MVRGYIWRQRHIAKCVEALLNTIRAGAACGARRDREKRYVTVISETTADGLVTPCRSCGPTAAFSALTA